LVGWWRFEALGDAIGSGLPILLALGALAAFSAAFTTWRLVQVAFDDPHSDSGKNRRRSSWVVGKPLLALAAIVLLGYGLGVLPGGLDGTWFERLVIPAVAAEPGLPLANPILAVTLMGMMILILVAGWFTPLVFDRFRPERPGQLLFRLRGLYNLAVNRFWLDELYGLAVIRPTIRLGHLLDRLDTGLIDRATGLPTAEPLIPSAAVIWEEQRRASALTTPASAWKVETEDREKEREGRVAVAGGASAGGVLGRLTGVSGNVSGWVEREGIGRASGAIGWLTALIAAVATSIERGVIDRAERVTVWLGEATARISAQAEGRIFQTGIHVGVPRASHGLGRVLTRTEAILGRPAVIGSILLLSLIGVLVNAL
ncbi:MAG: hypothetical protein WKH68_04360, partial [Candidatus Limnocylindria bacterium]